MAYYQQLFSDISQKQPHAVWKLINDVLGRERNSVSPTKIIYNSCALSGVALAEHFNSHFTNIGEPIGARSTVETLPNTPVDSIFLDPTNEIEIYRTFMALNNSKAVDADNIQIKPIKYVLPLITSVLTHF